VAAVNYGRKNSGESLAESCLAFSAHGDELFHVHLHGWTNDGRIEEVNGVAKFNYLSTPEAKRLPSGSPPETKLLF
jgi:hypothetical protein